MIDKIRRCPFCGGGAWIESDPNAHTIYVECKECHAQSRPALLVDVHEDMPVFKNIDEAAAYVLGAWERRPSD